jgi:hypothetical protein
MLVLVARYRGWRIERLQTIEARATQQSAESGSAGFYFAGDPPAVPAQPAKGTNPF